MFAKLREFDSLSKTKHKHLATIASQNERLTLLNKRRQVNQQKIEELKNDLSFNQSLLLDLEGQIKIYSEQRQRILDFGGDEKKARDYADKISIEEERGLEILSRIDASESELKDALGFDDGVGRTIEDISSEVKEVVLKEDKEILHIDQRLAALQEDLPLDFRDHLNRVLPRNLTHGPFTRIENGACFMCRFKISRMEESEIDVQKQLRSCSQCTRIFIPFGT